MASIKQQSIQLVKESVKISDVFEWLGAKVQRRGASTMAWCPFCADANSKSPGCSLSDDKGLFHCFVCQESGDVITAVMEHESLNFKEAVELLAETFNVPLEYEKTGNPEEASRRKKLTEVLEAAQQEFIAQRESEHYKKFLEERNITADDADKFGLGISLLDESDNVIQKLLQRFSQQDLIDAGLCFVSEQSGKLMLGFTNRLMFPIKTASGTLVAFGGRDLTGKSKAKYKNSPETEIFKKRDILYGMDVSKRAMNKAGRVIVCEGYMDTIALQTHGFEYAVGAMGTALTQFNLNKIGRFASQIFISLDSDEAGIRAAMRTAEVMPENFNSNIKVLVIPEVQCNNEEEVRATSLAKADEYLYKNVPVNPSYPDGEQEKVPVEFPVMVPMAKDPDEFFNQVGHTTEEFEKIIENAPDLFLFCVMMLTRQSISTIDEEIKKENPNQESIAHAKIKARRDVDDFMVKIYAKTNIYQRRQIAAWLISAARLLDTENKLENDWTQRAVTSGAFNKNKKTPPAQSQSKSANTTFSNAATQEEDLLIATLYYHPSSRKTVKENLENIKLVFTSPEREAIFTKLDEGYGKGLSAKEATLDLSETQTRELSRIVMEAEEHKDKISENAIKKFCKQIEAHALERKIEQEANAAQQDIMTIIELKTKLAAMKAEIKQMENN